MNITQLSQRLNLGMQYTRKLVVEGRITSTMVPISEGSKTMRHEITEEAVKKFLEAPRKTGFARREDGRSRFVLYATEAELAAIKAAAPQALIQKQANTSTIAKVSKLTNQHIAEQIAILKAVKTPTKYQVKKLAALVREQTHRTEKATK